MNNNFKGQFFPFLLFFFFKYENTKNKNVLQSIDKILILQFEYKNYVSEKRTHYEIKWREE